MCQSEPCFSLLLYLGFTSLDLTAVFQPYRDLEAGDNQSLKLWRRDWESNPEPLALQAKSFSITSLLLSLFIKWLNMLKW